jgi:2,3-bisphosphoglycerate-dependent phosphoglycerate mutase
MLDIYLFRHSHVDYTPPNQISPYNPLTPLGHEMAARLAERCEAWNLQYLFVSTMRRAQETANAISARWPELPRLNMDEIEEENLRDLAGYDGPLPGEDLREWQREHFAYGNERMWQRVTAGWDKINRIIEERQLERVAIVAHGGPINHLLRYFIGFHCAAPGEAWFDLDWTATSCLREAQGRRWIRWVNDARHIDVLRAQLGE